MSERRDPRVALPQTIGGTLSIAEATEQPGHDRADLPAILIRTRFVYR
jgi:hypothetical protein